MEKSSKSFDQRKQIYEIAKKLSKFEKMDCPISRGNNAQWANHKDRLIKDRNFHSPENDISYEKQEVSSHDSSRKQMNKKFNNSVHGRSFQQRKFFSESFQSSNIRQQKNSDKLQDWRQQNSLNNSSLINSFSKQNEKFVNEHSRIIGKELVVIQQKQKQNILTSQIDQSDEEEDKQVHFDQKVSHLERLENIKPKQYQIKQMDNSQLSFGSLRKLTNQELKNERRKDMQSFLLDFLNYSELNQLDNQILEALEDHFDDIREITQGMTNEQKTKFLLQNLIDQKKHLLNSKTNFSEKSKIRKKQQILYDKLIEIVSRIETDQEQQDQKEIASQKISSTYNNSVWKQRQPHGCVNNSSMRKKIQSERQQKLYQSPDPQHVRSPPKSEHFKAFKNGQRQLYLGLGNTIVNAVGAWFPNASKNFKWRNNMKKKLSSMNPRSY